MEKKKKSTQKKDDGDGGDGEEEEGGGGGGVRGKGKRSIKSSSVKKFKKKTWMLFHFVTCG